MSTKMQGVSTSWKYGNPTQTGDRPGFPIEVTLEMEQITEEREGISEQRIQRVQRPCGEKE